VNGQIDTSGGEGFFDLFGKHALGANFGQGDVGDFVAGGMNNVDFDFVSANAEQRRNVVGLPEGELRAAGADAKDGH
jgi:hypothetical protein